MKEVSAIKLLAVRHDGVTHSSTNTHYAVVAQHPNGEQTMVDIPFTAGKILEMHPMMLVVNVLPEKDGVKPTTPEFRLSEDYAKFLNEELPKRWTMQGDWDNAPRRKTKRK